METVFPISNCPEKYQVKYATCMILDSALTWWNSHKRTIGIEAAYAMSWAELMNLMTEVYCLRNEVQKIEIELWNLAVKGNDLTAYTRRFQELVFLCTRMVPNEEEKVERFVGGLPDNIQGNVIVVEPTKLQDAIRIANKLMDQKLKGYARSAENKRWLDNNLRDNRGQQPVLKRQNVKGQNMAKAYKARNNKKKRAGHITRDGMTIVTPNTQRAPVRNQPGIVCYECGRPGHFRKDCPKLRNQNRGNKTGNKNGNKTGNQTGGNKATSKAYAIRRGGANPNSNVVTGTFLLNNCYALMLFDSGADRSFVSSTFSALLNVAPSTLDTSYAVELVDGRISETNVVLRGYTLGLLGHLFDIDLMPVELGSFDVIIGMDFYRASLRLDIRSSRSPSSGSAPGNHVNPVKIGALKKWEKITMDLVTKIPRTSKGHDTILDVFHVLNLKECLTDETLVVPLEELQITDKLQFIYEPLEIMDHEVKRLNHSRILIIKDQ
ncbi:putative reverse transcriptase domain-containing protein [Tanacetum coccineum]